MIVHLPKDLEASILAIVQSGRFASLDDAMTRAATLLVEHIAEQAGQANAPAEAETTPAGPRKPIWERIVERSASIPSEEWDKLPVDGAEQHDHYIYGTPKRPLSP